MFSTHAHNKEFVNNVVNGLATGGNILVYRDLWMWRKLQHVAQYKMWLLTYWTENSPPKIDFENWFPLLFLVCVHYFFAFMTIHFAFFICIRLTCHLYFAGCALFCWYNACWLQAYERETSCAAATNDATWSKSLESYNNNRVAFSFSCAQDEMLSISSYRHNPILKKNSVSITFFTFIGCLMVDAFRRNRREIEKKKRKIGECDCVASIICNCESGTISRNSICYTVCVLTNTSKCP